MMRGILPLTFAVLAFSCSTTVPVPEIPFDDGYQISRSSLFQYKAPTGWLEVSDARDTSGVELWLVSPDFQQSLEVRRVSLDESLQEGLAPESAEAVARLLAEMARGDSWAMKDSVTEFVDGGQAYWSCEMSNPTGDLQRVSVFVAEERCFEMRSYVRGPAADKRTLTLHGEFLRMLHW